MKEKLEMELLSSNPIFLAVLLVLLAYSAYGDVKSRKVTTVYFLALDLFILVFYIYFRSLTAIFVIPVIMEFFIKDKVSFVPYILFLLPILFQPSLLNFSIAYSLIFIKLLLFIGRFGSADIKALQTIAVGIPTYAGSFSILIFYPPGLLVLLVSAASFLIALVLMKYSRGKGWPFAVPLSTIRPKEMFKYRVKGKTAAYLGPFMLYIMIGYVVLLMIDFL